MTLTFNILLKSTFPGIPPGMAPGKPPGIPPGMAPGKPPGIPPGMAPGKPPGIPPGMAPGKPPGIPPGKPPGLPPGFLLEDDCSCFLAFSYSAFKQEEISLMMTAS